MQIQLFVLQHSWNTWSPLTIDKKYGRLKQIALQLRNEISENNSTYKNLTFPQLRKADSDLAKHYELNLEQRALREEMDLWRCEEQWAANILLIEAFKSSRGTHLNKNPRSNEFDKDYEQSR